MGISSNSADSGLQDILSQINAQTGHFGVNNGDSLPGGVPPGSLATWQDDSNFYLSKSDGSRQFGAPFSIPKGVTGLAPLTSSAAPPTTDDLPNDGDFGFHLDTSTGFYWWALNDAGAVVFPVTAFDHLTGTLSLEQHGDLSGDSSTKHKFAQISGIITDAQHGNRGNSGGSAHDIATASDHGFMSTANFSKLALYPADCTTTATDSNAVQRSAGNVNVVTVTANTGYKVGANLVVGAREAAVPDLATDGSETTVTICTKVNTLLSKLRASTGHGLIG